MNESAQQPSSRGVAGFIAFKQLMEHPITKQKDGKKGKTAKI